MLVLIIKEVLFIAGSDEIGQFGALQIKVLTFCTVSLGIGLIGLVCYFAGKTLDKSEVHSKEISQIQIVLAGTESHTQDIADLNSKVAELEKQLNEERISRIKAESELRLLLSKQVSVNN